MTENTHHTSLSYKRIDQNDKVKHITPEMIQTVRELRKNQTTSEEKLWQLIRNRQLDGIKFLRQHPIGNCIVDFYCWKKKIAIELDGGIHQHPEVKDRDIARQTFLEENGINVIRFRNKEVLKDVSTVLEKILCIMN